MDDDIYDSHLYDDIAFDYRTPILSGSASRSASPFNQSQQQVSGQRLPLLQLSDWDENAAYDASPPTCIHYSIEWKLLLSKGRLTKLTYNPEQEPDLVLAPSAFWSRTLKATVEDLLRQKTPRNKTYKPEETNIVVSVSDRAERNLSKRFKEFDIGWGIIENQLEAWGHLFRAGRKLRMEISFICKEISQSAMPKTRQGGRRGATGRQHAELEAEQQEEEAAGRTNHWNKVYSLLRCTGPPCTGKHCLRGSDGKHFPVESLAMEKLVRYSEEGNVLETHADVPQFVRDLIYEKDRIDTERRSKKRKASIPAMPAIYIHNSLPEQPMCCSKEVFTGPSVESDDTVAGRRRAAPNIPGPRDEAIKRYCEWHCAQVTNDEWKRGFARAASMTLEEGLDLKHVYIDQNVDFYIQGGIKPGIARSWVEDIKKWVEESYTQE